MLPKISYSVIAKQAMLFQARLILSAQPNNILIFLENVLFNDIKFIPASYLEKYLPWMKIVIIFITTHFNLEEK